MPTVLNDMPLTSKGEEILSAMRKQYGEKKGESVFYASKNAGKVAGVDRADKLNAIADAVLNLADGVDCLSKRMDARISRSDASLAVHQFFAANAKKKAQQGLDAGDDKVAAQWVDYGSKHEEAAAAKEPKMERPPEAPKVDKKKK